MHRCKKELGREDSKLEEEGWGCQSVACCIHGDEVGKENNELANGGPG